MHRSAAPTPPHSMLGHVRWRTLSPAAYIHGRACGMCGMTTAPRAGAHRPAQARPAALAHFSPRSTAVRLRLQRVWSVGAQAWRHCAFTQKAATTARHRSRRRGTTTRPTSTPGGLQAPGSHAGRAGQASLSPRPLGGFHTIRTASAARDWSRGVQVSVIWESPGSNCVSNATLT